MGWNLVWRTVNSSTPEFTHIGAGVDTPKTVNFTKFWKYKRSAGACRARDSYKIFRVRGQSVPRSIHILSLVEFARSLPKLQGLTLGAFPPKFSGLLGGETGHRIRKSFKDAQVVRTSLWTCWVWWGWDFARHWGEGEEKFNILLFVCLFVTLLNSRDCANNFDIKTLTVWKRFWYHLTAEGS